MDRSIVDLDLRTSGISTGKKSFFNLEVNLYTNEELDFKSQELKDSVIFQITTILIFIKPKSKITIKLTQSVYLFLKEL